MANIGMAKTALIFVPLALSFLFLGISGSDRIPGISAGDRIGECAPAFELETIDGRRFHLSDYRGKKPIYLVFWNTWCHYCIKKVPRLRALHERYGDQIAIIGINTTRGDSLDAVKLFRERFEVNYPLAFDDGKVVTDEYHVVGTPTEFILDIDGVIRHRDSVPKDVATHLPDWSRSDPQMTAQRGCRK